MTAIANSAPNLKPTQLATAVAVELIGLNKWYGEFHVLRDINLKIMGGERIVICGPSGSGKSTMIRCINRLEEHQQGQIIVDGVELTNDLKKIDEVRRDVGMVFQHFNLFPHLTVLENCTLAPIWVRKTPKDEAYRIVRGKLSQFSSDQSGKVTSKSRELEMKSFPQDFEDESAPPPKKD